MGQLISGNKKPDYILLGIGSGLLVATIPLTILSNTHARKGVRMYNESVLKRKSQLKSKLDLQLSPTRAQIVYSF